MIEKEKVRFTIDAEGNIEMDISGIKGTGCEEIVKIFQGLGQITKNKPKMEYYEQPLENTPKIQEQRINS